ncbi:hypothetical protein COCSUDRAFT_64200, partial [Coccomyxa subellipsoidea C-169]
MAKDAIDLQTVSTQPLIVNPISFRLHNVDASEMLQQVLLDYGCEKKLTDFEPYGHDIANNDVCLAISLAWERNRGRQSPFYPYIRSLPEETPCFFTKENDEVRQILQELGTHSHEIERIVAMVDIERALFNDAVKAVVREIPLGKALGVTVKDVMWCFAHVLARRMNDGDDVAHGHIRPALCPVANHESAGLSFELGAGTSRIPGSMDVLVSLLDGVPRPLAAGDELYIAYRSPSGDTYEEQLVNHVEMRGAES